MAGSRRRVNAGIGTTCPGCRRRCARADVIAFATALYICTMSAPMKRFLDRICPMAEPYQCIEDGVCSHSIREGERMARFVLISVAGFPGLRNFEAPKLTFERLAEVGGDTLAGTILFPASPLLMMQPSPAAEQLEFVVQAGREIVAGDISAETSTGYSRPYVDDQLTSR